MKKLILTAFAGLLLPACKESDVVEKQSTSVPVGKVVKENGDRVLRLVETPNGSVFSLVDGKTTYRVPDMNGNGVLDKEEVGHGEQSVQTSVGREVNSIPEEGKDVLINFQNES